MALISSSNLLTILDHFAAGWDLLNPVGTKVGGYISGTVRDQVNRAFVNVVSDLNDYEQEQDLSQAFNAAVLGTNQENIARTPFQGVLGAVSGHISARGRAVATSIQDLPSFLAYYNGGAGGARFSNMVTAKLNDLYYALFNGYLGMVGVMSPALTPTNGQADGMGRRAVGGAFVDGVPVDTTKYSEVNLVAVCTVNFAAGTAPPTVTVTGTDHTGVTTMTWTGAFTGNNPTAAIATTLSGPVLAFTRTTVGVASAVGIVPGSILTIDAGTATAENVIVEAVAGSNITAVFKQAHNTAAPVAGFTTIALTPATGGRRCADVTNLVINITGHTAGTVRIEGVQDRVGV